MRPSSAFQLNPELRSSSASTVPQLPSQGGRASPYPPNGFAPASRPMTAQPHQQPYGGPGQRPIAGPRIASGPAGMQGYGARPLPTPGQPPIPQPGLLPHAPTAPQQQPQQQKLDIGFSAPAEVRGHSYGPRPGGGGGGKPASPVTAGGMGKSPSMPNFDHQQQQPMSSSGGGRSSRPGSRPPEERAPMPPAAGAPRPPVKDAASTIPVPKVSSSKPNSPAHSAPAQAKRPGKGPKTFDEMGVPQQSKESDCVSVAALRDRTTCADGPLGGYVVRVQTMSWAKHLCVCMRSKRGV